MADNDFLTVAEVADALRVNQQTVRNWIDRGALPAVRIGSRRVRVRQADLETFVGSGGIAVRRELKPKPQPQPQPLKVDPEVIDAVRGFGEAAVRRADALERHNA